MSDDQFSPEEEHEEHNLWSFSRDFGRAHEKRYFELHAARFGMEVISRQDQTFPYIFHDDGVCMRDDLVLDRKLVLLDNCVISSSQVIECRNCVFAGNVQILLEDTECSPSIHNSIFLGELSISISGSSSEVRMQPTLELHSSFASSLIIYSSNLSLLKIYGNVFRAAKFYDSKISALRVSANKFAGLSLANFSSDSTYFGPDQIPLNPIIEERTNCATLPFSPEELAHLQSSSRARTSEEVSRADTLDFLLGEADFRSNQAAKAHLKYLQLIDRSSKGPVRVAVWMCGGLLKPYRVLVCSALCIFIYAFLYWISIEELSAASSYLDCLYFSAISFTTIGFGDIVPSGIARFLSVSEGFAGIIFSSALVASIIRKYAE